MALVLHEQERSEAYERQNRSDHTFTGTQEHERDERVSGINSTLIQIFEKIFPKDRQNEKSTKERH